MTHGARPAERTIAVEGLARVEGEGSLRAVVRDGAVTEVELDDLRATPVLRGAASRPAPRRGAGHHGAHLRDLPRRLPDERLPRRSRTPAASTVRGPISALRRLLYCGEWIQSHALHVYLLHAPDFLGCEDAVELAERDRAAVERGLRLKKVGQPGDGDGRAAAPSTP